MALKSLRGYHGNDPVTHRPYSRKISLQRYRRTGKFAFRRSGEGHAAGENWAREKRIDPDSRVYRYGKNSPSFDEGVYKYKKESKASRQAREESLMKALESKKK